MFVNLKYIKIKMNKKLIIASTSTVFGGKYLDYLLPSLSTHFKDCKAILFIPYAQPGGISYDDYTKKVKVAFATIDINVKGIHEYQNPIDAINNAEAIFTGGGNTFLLVTKLYEKGILEPMKKVLENGIPYLGTSAGSNITGVSMKTTNDMPIIYPPSFVTLGLIPFNVNPHYIDADASSNHMGETREQRINEFHTINSLPVLGLREGSWLLVNNDKIILKGNLTARLFLQNQLPQEIESDSDLSYL